MSSGREQGCRWRADRWATGHYVVTRAGRNQLAVGVRPPKVSSSASSNAIARRARRRSRPSLAGRRGSASCSARPQRDGSHPTITLPRSHGPCGGRCWGVTARHLSADHWSPLAWSALRAARAQRSSGSRAAVSITRSRPRVGMEGLERVGVDLGEGRERLDGVAQHSSRTLARIARVACWSHSPASGRARTRR